MTAPPCWIVEKGAESKLFAMTFAMSGLYVFRSDRRPGAMALSPCANMVAARTAAGVLTSNTFTLKHFAYDFRGTHTTKTA